MLISPRVRELWHKFHSFLDRGLDSPRDVLIHGMNYAPEFIGVGKYTTELAKYLNQQRCAVDVVTAWPHYPGWRVQSSRPWRYATSLENGVRVTRCPLATRPGGRVWRLIAPFSFAVAAAPVVLWRCLRARPRVVLCVEPTLFAAPAALLGAWLAGARTVLHVQDLEIDAAFATGYLGSRFLARVAGFCERALLRRFGAVVTISDAMAARLRRRGVPPERLHLMRNWVVPETPDPEAAANLRARIGVAADDRVVLYAGNLGAKQGLSVLIEAARRLRAAPGIRFVVVGDGPLLPAVRAAAASLPNLDLLPLLPRSAFAGLLRGTDLHVLPQDRAAAELVFPSKLGPILASGKPVLVTAGRDSDLGRWLGAAALLSPPGDGRALAAAVLAAVAGRSVPDPDRAAHLAATLQATTVLPAFAGLLTPADDARSVPATAGPAAPLVAYLPAG